MGEAGYMLVSIFKYRATWNRELGVPLKLRTSGFGTLFNE